MRFWVLAYLCFLLGCGAGAVGEAIAPEAHSASDALGEEQTCRAVAAYAEPLIVDWKAQQRLDLELAMKHGVAVVAYTCERFELLKGCSVNGSYSFAGVSRKEDVVQLTNRDEVKANLPLSGATLSASLERGATIDLALVMIGKKATTVSKANGDDLEGACAGATHIVRAATIGAFAMDRGTLGAAKAAAELFGAGVSGGSDAKRREKNTDGQVGACKKASSTDEVPPDQCQAALRLELVPIGSESDVAIAAERAPAKAKAKKNPCPEGMVWNGSKCTKPLEAESYLCEDKNFDDCQKQCDAGDAGSCYNLGVLLTRDAANYDVPRARAAFHKACEKEHAEACRYEARHVCRSIKSEPECQAKRRELVERACDLGDGDGCMALLFDAKRFGLTTAEAVPYGKRACDLGSAWGCGMYGLMYVIGDEEGGVKRDVEKGLAILERSCEGQDKESCMFMSSAFDKEDVPDDPVRHAKALKIACQLEVLAACSRLGELYKRGAKNIAADVDRAAAYWRRACPEGLGAIKEACTNIGQHLRIRGKNDEALKFFMRACKLYGADGSCMRAAEIAGTLVVDKLHHQCQAGDGVACEELAPRLLEQGCERGDRATCKRLEKRYPQRTRAFWERMCTQRPYGTHWDACGEYERLGGKLSVAQKSAQATRKKMEASRKKRLEAKKSEAKADPKK